MAFNINEFKSQLVGGGARSNLFQVQLLNPVDPSADFKIPFMVKASTLPASTITSIDSVNYFGRQVKYAGSRTFAEWGVTVINDEDFLVRNSMEAWMNSIATHDTNLRGLPQDYKTTALITQYSKNGEALRTYKFEGLFPTSIAAQTMDWDTDGIQTFDVTFSYDLWMVEGKTGIPTT
jgi:hypothetical protein